MGSASSTLRPQELVEFRKSHVPFENIEIPARAENRRVTDKKGFLIFGIGLLILLCFLIYTLTKTDPNFILRDRCANLCGVKNEPISGLPCSGQDYTHFPYLFNKTCVESCPESLSADSFVCLRVSRLIKRDVSDIDFSNFETKLRRSEAGKEFEKMISKGLDASSDQWWKFVLTAAFTIALGVLALVGLRYLPGIFVCLILILFIVFLIILTAAFWLLWAGIDDAEVYRSTNQFDENREQMENVKQFFLALAISMTIIDVILFVIFIVLFRKIGLVIQLYKEATKALADMPFLVFVPVGITVVQTTVVLIAITTTFYMFFSVEWYRVNDYTYLPARNGAMLFAIIFNIAVTCWVMRFIQAIQYMTISGSVATWYFAKNKDNLDSPIYRNYRITMKFHLGTAFFGSFILTLFAVVKMVIRSVFRNACCRCCVMFCCSNLEIVLKFLSENAYIETSIHGQSYLRSAKRATKLLLQNAKSMIAINCVGDFVLGVMVFMLAVLATVISYALFKNNGPDVAIIPAVFSLIINIIILSVIFSTLEAIIDTLFICFCEDTNLNDGMSRPYYMSRGLMEFVENSKKMYEAQKIR